MCSFRVKLQRVYPSVFEASKVVNILIKYADRFILEAGKILYFFRQKELLFNSFPVQGYKSDKNNYETRRFIIQNL